MVDYLEGLWTHTDALLEQLRRMEGDLAGLNGGDSRGGADFREEAGNVSPGGSLAYNQKGLVYHIENMVDESELPKNDPAEPEIGTVNPVSGSGDDSELVRQPGEGLEPGETQREGRAPLADQLDQMDRAVQASAGETRIRRGDELAEVSAPAGRRAAHPNIQTPDIPETDRTGIRDSYGPAPDWVEQADRAFRRDSRRYDGSFYLY